MFRDGHHVETRFIASLHDARLHLNPYNDLFPIFYTIIWHFYIIPLFKKFKYFLFHPTKLLDTIHRFTDTHHRYSVFIRASGSRLTTLQIYLYWITCLNRQDRVFYVFAEV